MRQSALHCLLAVVRGVEKRMLYGYWSSFIPDAPMAGPPPLTLLSIVLKDSSPKVSLSLSLTLSLSLSLTQGSSVFLTHSPKLSLAFYGPQYKNGVPLVYSEKGRDNYDDIIGVHTHLSNRICREVILPRVA